jgi:V/A-type H+-transporting ATPase subunit E
MEQKLENLTQKIYDEGVERAKKDAEEIIQKARKDAEKIIHDAQTQAEKIHKQADNESAELKRNTRADLHLAANQAISALKQQIKELLALRILKKQTSQLFADPAFLKEMILAITQKWDPREAVEIQLDDSLRNKIDEAFENSIRKEVQDLTIDFNKRLSRGFRISPEGDAFQITFTDEDFNEFFRPYINEKTEKILFSK